MGKKITIAIDGYSSCGKSSLAKKLAKKFNYLFIDTGAMYRAITFYALKNQIISPEKFDIALLINSLSNINIELKYDEKAEITLVFLNDEDITQEIRKPIVAQFVSKIASVKEVRQKLVDLQRQQAKNGGVILDGRDIGTVVFPNAELKIFLTASEEERTRRRYEEMKQSGIETSFEEVMMNLKERDYLDTHREESPLKMADDAILLDNTHLSIEDEIQIISEIFVKKL